MTAPFRAVVLGAGVEALACACELAVHGIHGGVRVTIVQTREERDSFRVQRSGGFSFDTDETMITRPDLLHSLFSRAGRVMADYLALIELDPFTRFWFDDGVVINFRRDAGLFARQIDQQFPLDRQGANFCNFVLAKRARDHARIPELLRLVGERHVNAVCLHTYETWETPAVDGGMWYSFGGVRQVGFALERLAAELGVDFVIADRVDTPAPSTDGIRGTQVCVDDVAMNADSVIDCRDKSRPSAMLLWGIDRRYPHLAHQNIFCGDDWDIRLSAPCALDPAHAPVGGDALTLELMLPEAEVANARRHAIRLLKFFGMSDIERRIVFERATARTSGGDAGQSTRRGIERARKMLESCIAGPVDTREPADAGVGN